MCRSRQEGKAGYSSNRGGRFKQRRKGGHSNHRRGRFKQRGSSDIQVIEVDDSSKGSNEVVALHLPNRRRREVTKSKKNKHICKKDSDCGPGYICLANVACVKGKRRIISSVKVKDKN
ncbi:uncharacterized protein LOC105837404 isoform X3 [Monomorium pharaonis]|uniref:uncharacterized protein LOC105837404 isoform X3 n=1 Tax=Monomorium pharaonis TaxID=307658 RepID=UPI00063F0437|nr:uncharacterized protein LOC105837404 isoform X3 [Monomorium pharaonis]